MISRYGRPARRHHYHSHTLHKTTTLAAYHAQQLQPANNITTSGRPVSPSPPHNARQRVTRYHWLPDGPASFIDSNRAFSTPQSAQNAVVTDANPDREFHAPRYQLFSITFVIMRTITIAASLRRLPAFRRDSLPPLPAYGIASIASYHARSKPVISARRAAPYVALVASARHSMHTRRRASPLAPLRRSAFCFFISLKY